MIVIVDFPFHLKKWSSINPDNDKNKGNVEDEAFSLTKKTLVASFQVLTNIICAIEIIFLLALASFISHD